MRCRHPLARTTRGIEMPPFVAKARDDGREVVGLPGFEPGSIGPKPTSIDQTNPQAPIKTGSIDIKNFARAISKIVDHF